MKFCCTMRERFLISIIGEDKNAPQPENLVDFVIDWERNLPLIAIAYCPFCGAKIDITKDPVRRL